MPISLTSVRRGDVLVLENGQRVIVGEIGGNYVAGPSQTACMEVDGFKNYHRGAHWNKETGKKECANDYPPGSDCVAVEPHGVLAVPPPEVDPAIKTYMDKLAYESMCNLPIARQAAIVQDSLERADDFIDFIKELYRCSAQHERAAIKAALEGVQ